MSGNSSSSNSMQTPSLPSFLLQTPIHKLGLKRKLTLTSTEASVIKPHPIQLKDVEELAPLTPKISAIRPPNQRSLTFPVTQLLLPRPAVLATAQVPVPVRPSKYSYKYTRRRAEEPGAAAPDWRPKQHESRCLQRIAPGLYIAFQDDFQSFKVNHKTREKTKTKLYREQIRTPNGESFTHIVNLCTAAKEAPKAAGVGQRVCTASGQRQLKIIILDETEEEESDTASEETMYDDMDDLKPRGTTSLDRTQLLVIRDFLATSGHKFFNDSSSEARLLITGPRDRRTDVVSALVCYMSYASGISAHDILSLHDSEKETASVWQSVVSRFAVEFVASCSEA